MSHALWSQTWSRRSVFFINLTWLECCDVNRIFDGGTKMPDKYVCMMSDDGNERRRYILYILQDMNA